MPQHHLILLKPFILLAFSAILFSACTKQKTDCLIYNDALETKFFSLSSINDTDIINFALKIKIQFRNDNFLQTFILNNGYVLWNDAEKIKNSSGILTILPFASENKNEINGFIIVRQDNQFNKVTFDVFNKNNLAQYGFVVNSKTLNAQKVQTIINYFNYKKYNINSCKIIDERQLPDSIRLKYHNNIDIKKFVGKFKFQQNGVNTFSAIASATSCFGYYEATDWWYNPNGDKCNCDGDEYYAYTSYNYSSVCFDAGGGGGYGGED